MRTASSAAPRNSGGKIEGKIEGNVGGITSDRSTQVAGKATGLGPPKTILIGLMLSMPRGSGRQSVRCLIHTELND